MCFNGRVENLFHMNSLWPHASAGVCRYTFKCRKHLLYDVSITNNGSLRVLHRFHPVLKAFCSTFDPQWQPFTKQWRDESIQFCNLLKHSGFYFFDYYVGFIWMIRPLPEKMFKWMCIGFRNKWMWQNVLCFFSRAGQLDLQQYKMW